MKFLVYARPIPAGCLPTGFSFKTRSFFKRKNYKKGKIAEAASGMIFHIQESKGQRGRIKILFFSFEKGGSKIKKTLICFFYLKFNPYIALRIEDMRDKWYLYRNYLLSFVIEIHPIGK